MAKPIDQVAIPATPEQVQNPEVAQEKPLEEQKPPLEQQKPVEQQRPKSQPFVHLEDMGSQMEGDVDELVSLENPVLPIKPEINQELQKLQEEYNKLKNELADLEEKKIQDTRYNAYSDLFKNIYNLLKAKYGEKNPKLNSLEKLLTSKYESKEKEIKEMPFQYARIQLVELEKDLEDEKKLQNLIEGLKKNIQNARIAIAFEQAKMGLKAAIDLKSNRDEIKKGLKKAEKTEFDQFIKDKIAQFEGIIKDAGGK